MTEIKSAFFPNDNVSIVLDDTGAVCVEILNGGYRLGILVDREEFAQAVRDLGFEVIDKAELPEVAVDAANDPSGIWVGEYRYVNTADHIGAALRHLAVAAHLEANPPTDPKVEALAEILRAAVGVTPESSAAGHLIPSSSNEVAARMFATGRIQVTE